MLSFTIVGKVVSGTGVEVFNRPVSVDRATLIIENTGSEALTAGKVQFRVGAATTPADLDTTTFGTLAASGVKELKIDQPMEWLRFLADCAAGTTLNATLVVPPGD
jgi:hypothetical protein